MNQELVVPIVSLMLSSCALVVACWAAWVTWKGW